LATINIKEIHADLFLARKRANNRSECLSGTPLATDHLSDIAGVHSDLQHPPATQIQIAYRHIIGAINNPTNQVL
jgi:hypothetical protein